MKRVLFPFLVMTLLAWMALLALLLSACSSSLLPTLDVTMVPTTLPTVTLTTLPQADNTVVASPAPPLVAVVGTVNLRDADGAVVGWLAAGDRVQAVCGGQWCAVVAGEYAGYKFWRGCSGDNPEGLGCQEAE